MLEISNLVLYSCCTEALLLFRVVFVSLLFNYYHVNCRGAEFAAEVYSLQGRFICAEKLMG